MINNVLVPWGPFLPNTVIYQQINKDHAYWTEKRRVGQTVGGHTSGLLVHFNDKGEVETCLLIDVGLHTIAGLCDLQLFHWEWPLAVLVTHGHPDHHIELSFLSELWCKREAKRRGPLEVYCTGSVSTGTMKFLQEAHRYGFGRGNTLQHVQPAIAPGASVTHGIFEIHVVDASSHFDGAVNYVVEFGQEPRHKIIIGWDMKDTPTVIPLLQNPSLSLIEANTWTQQSQTGHVSVHELVTSGFLRDLQATIDLVAERYGIWLVHYGGKEEPSGIMDDGTLEILFKQIGLQAGIGGIGGVARRGQLWKFRVCRA